MKMRRALPLCGLLALLDACNGQERSAAAKGSAPAVEVPMGDTVHALGRNIDWILQDRKDHYWFATNGDGVYRYDGKTLLHITAKHGLCGDQVWSIREDVNGHLWFATRDGICRYDGTAFEDFTARVKNALPGPVGLVKGGLFFGHLDGICYYNGRSFVNFTIAPPTYRSERGNLSRPYSIYSDLIDRAGHAWFGTEQKGVCRFDGASTTWFTEAGLSDAAVRCVFQDRNGDLWFGNNGAGLFRYDGKALTNVTEEKGLGNPTFLKDHRVGDTQGTLARVWSIAEDPLGNLWVGTIDAGLWKLSGDGPTNYTTADGLPGNAIWRLYTDHTGTLWVVTDGDAVCRFDGKSFTRVRFD